MHVLHILHHFLLWPSNLIVPKPTTRLFLCIINIQSNHLKIKQVILGYCRQLINFYIFTDLYTAGHCIFREVSSLQIIQCLEMDCYDQWKLVIWIIRSKEIWWVRLEKGEIKWERRRRCGNTMMMDWETEYRNMRIYIYCRRKWRWKNIRGAEVVGALE